jgi:MFS family permease
MKTTHKAQTTPRISLAARFVLLLGANLSITAGSSLSPVIPEMTKAFSGVPHSAFWVPMVFTLPALFVVLGGPVVGFLTDRLGRKPVLVFSIFLGGLGGSLGAVFGSLGGILFTRALVGLSIAGAMTATNSLIADYFTGEQRTKFMGRQAAIGGLTSIVFLPLGGLVAEVNWRLAFLSYLPMLILLPMALLAIKEPAITADHQPLVKKATLKLDIEKIYIFSASFFSQFSFVTVPIYVAYFLAAVLGTGGQVVGWLGAASSLFSFFAGILYGGLSGKNKFKRIAIGNYFLFFAGFLILGLARSWAPVILGELILGFCMGLNNANLANWLSNVVDIRVRGRANGIYATLMSLGPFTAPFFFSPINLRWNYSLTFIISSVIFGLMGLVGILIPAQSTSRDGFK